MDLSSNFKRRIGRLSSDDGSSQDNPHTPATSTSLASKGETQLDASTSYMIGVAMTGILLAFRIEFFSQEKTKAFSQKRIISWVKRNPLCTNISESPISESL